MSDESNAVDQALAKRLEAISATVRQRLAAEAKAEAKARMKARAKAEAEAEAKAAEEAVPVVRAKRKRRPKAKDE